VTRLVSISPYLSTESGSGLQFYSSFITLNISSGLHNSLKDVVDLSTTDLVVGLAMIEDTVQGFQDLSGNGVLPEVDLQFQGVHLGWPQPLDPPDVAQDVLRLR